MTEERSIGLLVRRRTFLKYSALGAAATALGTLPALAATDYPSRPVTVIVPYSAGGNTDTMARLVCNYLTQKHGQTFVVENQPTAGGVVGTETVARADPDGYTLLFGAATMIIIRPILQELNYDAESFAPVSILGSGPYILGIRSSLPPTNLEEFVEYAKNNPGAINYASAGTGGNAHLTTAKFAASAGIDIVEIPYPGGGPASTAFAGGEIDMYFGNASEMMRFVDNPDIRLLAVSSPERMEALADVPALAEIFDNFRSTTWNGFLAPAATPQEIIDIIEQGTMEAARDPEISARLTSLGIEPVGSTAQELAEIIEQDKVFYAEAIETAGLKVE